MIQLLLFTGWIPIALCILVFRAIRNIFISEESKNELFWKPVKIAYYLSRIIDLVFLLLWIIGLYPLVVSLANDPALGSFFMANYFLGISLVIRASFFLILKNFDWAKGKIYFFDFGLNVITIYYLLPIFEFIVSYFFRNLLK